MVTIRDSYPLSQIDKAINSPGVSRIFAMLQAYSEYWQVELNEQDGKNNIYTSHNSLYQVARMLFKITIAPVTL